MTTMCEEGERTCPLCMEEMDLTDRQLKPCKCGYEICVWCWNHIVDMAEKDETEGRCPACRVPYEKEKIVAMAVSRERLAEINSERRSKSQKAKPRTSEGRKHLSSVRVIQRNLVYIIGIPSNIADEETLERREYFGQYGKVLKVSITRMASGSQHAANNTCSVYITYAKEDEAIRCIQLVNGFVLEGKLLRACFGTTKYCHAWLRNMPCNNPDCLYLHDVGTQEDSFTKDEIIAGCTRSRLQQITGISNHLQRRSGNVLPPPTDEFYIDNNTATSGKITVKNTVQNHVTQVKNSPPNGTLARPSILPAAASWGMRVANGRPSAVNTCSQGPATLKTDTSQCSMVPLTSYEGNIPTVTEETGATHLNSKEPGPLESSWQYSVRGSPTGISDTLVECSLDKARIETTCTRDHDGQSYGACLDNAAIGENVQNLCSELSSVSINCQLGGELIETSNTYNSISDHPSSGFHGTPLADLRQYHVEHGAGDSLTAETLNKSAMMSQGASDWSSDLQNGDDRRFQLSEASDHLSYLSHSNSSLEIPANSAWHMQPDQEVVEASVLYTAGDPILSSGGRNGGIFERPVEKSGCLGRTDGGVDLGESGIISNMLSLDFDGLDGSLTSSQNLMELLFGETDKSTGSKLPSASNVQSSNQSRFSFARQEDFINQASYLEPYCINNGPTQKNCFDPQRQDYVHVDKYRNGYMASSFDNSNINSQPLFPTNKVAVSRSQISAPPGFSVPRRAPPPGFSSREINDRVFATTSGNENFSLLRNQFQTGVDVNTSSNADVEFIDPAILAVGRGKLPLGIDNSGLDFRTSFSDQPSTFENDLRVQMLLQKSMPASQSMRFSDHTGGDRFALLSDTHVPSRLIEQQMQGNIMSPFPQMSHHQSRNSYMSNGQWDGWSGIQNGGDLGMPEIVRNERLGGYDKYFTAYEDLKFRLAGSGDIYNRTFGM